MLLVPVGGPFAYLAADGTLQNLQRLQENMSRDRREWINQQAEHLRQRCREFVRRYMQQTTLNWCIKIAKRLVPIAVYMVSHWGDSSLRELQGYIRARCDANGVPLQDLMYRWLRHLDWLHYVVGALVRIWNTMKIRIWAVGQKHDKLRDFTMAQRKPQSRDGWMVEMWAKGEGQRQDIIDDDNREFFHFLRKYVTDIMNGTTRYDGPSVGLRWWGRVMLREVDIHMDREQRRISGSTGDASERERTANIQRYGLTRARVRRSS